MRLSKEMLVFVTETTFTSYKLNYLPYSCAYGIYCLDSINVSDGKKM